MVQAYVDQKLLKRDILRVFLLTLFIIFKEIIVEDRNSKRVFKE
jgi:hypothetical protein